MTEKDMARIDCLRELFLDKTAGEDMCLDYHFMLDPEGKQRKPHCAFSGKVIHEGMGVMCSDYHGSEFDFFLQETDQNCSNAL